MTETTTQQTICFIGGGNMAAALIGGMLEQGTDASRISAADPAENQRSQISQAFGVQTFANNREAVAQASAVVLAVKPQILRPVLEDLAGHIRQDAVIISIVAGVTCESIAGVLGSSQPVIRAMPNTPALICQGATGLYAQKTASSEDRKLALMLFEAVGKVVWVTEEDHLHAVTALSGSGPAYFFLLIEALESAAVELGLPAESARLLAGQTALGAASLLTQSDSSAQTLRQRVTSPGGTTQQAIEIFEAADLRDIVRRAAAGAAQRSDELAKEF